MHVNSKTHQASMIARNEKSFFFLYSKIISVLKKTFFSCFKKGNFSGFEYYFHVHMNAP